MCAVGSVCPGGFRLPSGTMFTIESSSSGAARKTSGAAAVLDGLAGELPDPPQVVQTIAAATGPRYLISFHIGVSGGRASRSAAVF